MTLAPQVGRLMPPVRITVEQYHRMIEAGILGDGEPIELLEGQLVRKDRSAAGEDPMSVGDRHASGTEMLVDLNPKLKRLKCYIRVQSPVRLSDVDEPEPDGAIVRGSTGTYSGGRPTVADILCLIEVSDSSLEEDRDRKQRIYANAGVQQYVIVNLVDDVVEVYTEPRVGRGRYASVQAYPRGKRVELRTATKPLVVRVADLLPS